jgi:3-oxoacyl-[acyl-carrier protein] reductase
VIATGRIMQTVIPGSSQSNRDRADLVALRRLGTVEDCAKVVEFCGGSGFLDNGIS